MPNTARATFKVVLLTVNPTARCLPAHGFTLNGTVNSPFVPAGAPPAVTPGDAVGRFQVAGLPRPPEVPGGVMSQKAFLRTFSGKPATQSHIAGNSATACLLRNSRPRRSLPESLATAGASPARFTSKRSRLLRVRNAWCLKPGS